MFDAGSRHLLACLEPSRAERLDPEHLLRLVELARDRDCHAGMQYIAKRLRYAMPAPIQPADELAELLRRQERLLEQQRHLANQTEQAMARAADQQQRGRNLRTVGG